MAFLFASKDADGKSIAFSLVRGTEWQDDVQIVDQASGDPVDLTGIASMMMRIREDIASADHLMELSIANGRLVLVDAAAGKVGIRVTSEQTLEFPQNDNAKAKYVSDIVIERTSGRYEPGVAAKVKVLPQVTRPTESA